MEFLEVCHYYDTHIERPIVPVGSPAVLIQVLYPGKVWVLGMEPRQRASLQIVRVWKGTVFLGVFRLFPLHQTAHVGVSPIRGLKLFGREIIFEEFQPI